MTDRRRAAWPTRMPEADAALRESVVRVTARDAQKWGGLLARLRAAGLSLADQAATIGTTASALVFLSVCRLPRAGRRDEDLASAAALVGIPVAVLRGLLGGTAEAEDKLVASQCGAFE